MGGFLGQGVWGVSWGKGYGEFPGSGGHQGRERGRGATGKCPDRRVRGEVFVKSLCVRPVGCMLLTKVIISLTISGVVRGAWDPVSGLQWPTANNPLANNLAQNNIISGQNVPTSWHTEQTDLDQLLFNIQAYNHEPINPVSGQ